MMPTRVSAPEDALRELIDKDLSQPFGNKGVVFKVTRRGYEFVDRVGLRD
jgi:hypothetical protein